MFVFISRNFSGTISSCPPIELMAIEGEIKGFVCPVYASCSSRLDRPLFNLIVDEQIDKMTYIVFDNG